MTLLDILCQELHYALDKHILPALGNMPQQKLTTQRLQSFYNSKQQEQQSSSSIQTMHKVLHNALKYTVNLRLLSYNPNDYVSLPRQVKRKVKPLTLEQARHLLDVARGGSLEGLLTLALATGMRHGEPESSSVPAPACRTMPLECRAVADFSADGQVIKTRATNELSERDRVPFIGL